MHFWKKKDNLIIIGCVALFFIGLMIWQEKGAVRASLSGIPSPALNISFFDKEYRSHTLAEFKGKPFIVEFWATWCPSCVKKMGTLNTFAKKFQSKGGHVIAISEDSGGFEKVQEYYARNRYDNLKVYVDDNGSLMSAVGTAGLPTVIFFNAKGEEMHRITGGIDWESPEFAQLVHTFLGIRVK